MPRLAIGWLNVGKVLVLAYVGPMLVQCWLLPTLAQCWPSIGVRQRWPSVGPMLACANVGPTSTQGTIQRCANVSLPTLGQRQPLRWPNVGPTNKCYLGYIPSVAQLIPHVGSNSYSSACNMVIYQKHDGKSPGMIIVSSKFLLDQIDVQL